MDHENDLTKVVDDVLGITAFAAEHTPVLAREILLAFAPLKGERPLRIFDGTYGRGGHFRAVNALFAGQVAGAVVMDQDAEAIAAAELNQKDLVDAGKLEILRANFAEFPDRELGKFDCMLLDLGVSSPQLDTAERGFSFYHDGPLDMRMNRDQELTAETLLNTSTEDELNEIFKTLGEVRRPFRVTRAIVHDRRSTPYKTTRELASLIERVDGWRTKGVHPATQYFMALRLAVNDELGVLERTLHPMMNALNDGGRLAVLTFHSLEDRIVKNIFRDPSAPGKPVNKKVIIADDGEAKANPRARSAKLRVFERGVQDERR